MRINSAPTAVAFIIAVFLGVGHPALVLTAQAWPPNPRPTIPQRRWEYDRNKARKQLNIRRDIDRLRLKRKSRRLDRKIERMKSRSAEEDRGVRMKSNSPRRNLSVPAFSGGPKSPDSGEKSPTTKAGKTKQSPDNDRKTPPAVKSAEDGDGVSTDEKQAAD